MNIALPKNKQLILFDGVCNLCNSSVNFIIKNDKTNTFLFSALQSKSGKQIIEAYHIDTTKTDSILLYNPDKGISYKSSAALKIAWHLKGPLKLLTVFLIVPRFIRNWVYDIIARNRYRWFGKKEACMVPSPELKDKFLD
ncbi:thiol-disulfide oxidoreductase DCC family protein [Aestuariibaculum sediminum]|uniref:DUF393 domain-containing protein n=1 Tax=Aestuariibaculum sediminum TaxID=2770637 RepID=A0A8J6Q6W1_9FLAO|nr:DCC1-like thiol-disulfide oxidoreductase family protein [Aestuariibaculum sediminum]MBD0832143.1 DUF393 domain-containing protein [Aestuariibaculum sediminum]